MSSHTMSRRSHDGIQLPKWLYDSLTNWLVYLALLVYKPRAITFVYVVITITDKININNSSCNSNPNNSNNNEFNPYKKTFFNSKEKKALGDGLPKSHSY